MFKITKFDLSFSVFVIGLVMLIGSLILSAFKDNLIYGLGLVGGMLTVLGLICTLIVASNT